jgi:intracellular septation protein
MTDTPRRAPPQWLASLIEFAPLGAFLATYVLTDDLMAATAVVMAASAVAVVVSFVVQRKIPWMPLITAVLVGVFGGLTLYLQDEDFIKMKPTVINLLFAGVLLGAMALGKLPLRLLMGGAIEMPTWAWRRFTLRTGLFFIAVAVLNEAVWRTQPEHIWVYFRFPGLMLITFAYFGSQIPFMMRHGEQKTDQ